ncbi:uncharacterized protein [Montipora foliosa]|uniref:uncharacterized protein isoform X2 n=1 Tax=Montipora foliosa TaxID=591990 RepID=UPI0035F1F757
MTKGHALTAVKRMKVTMMRMTVMPLTLGEKMTQVMSFLHSSIQMRKMPMIGQMPYALGICKMSVNSCAVPLCLPNNCKWNEQTGEYSKDEDKERSSLHVTKSALEQLKTIEGPVCVVSIAGPCRKGKSYIIGEVFDQGEVFPLGHELDPETMGIWMWIVPQKFQGNKLDIIP